MIIEWPLNGQFHEAITDVLMSRTDVFRMADDDNDDVQTLVAILRVLKML